MLHGSVSAVAPTLPVFTLDLGEHATDVVLHSPMAQQPGIARFRQKLAVARTGGLSVTLLILADSRARNSAGRWRNAWPDRLLRRLMGATPHSPGFLPPSQNTFSGVTDPDWAGGDNPWTYAGSISPNGTYGVGYHAVNVPSGGGSATITYFGDRIFVYYVQNPTGPTAATVTLDGTSVGPLDANDAATVAGKQAQYGTSGNYGFHTLVITPNDGTLVLEGVQWYDRDAPFFNTASIQLIDGSHAGFNLSPWGVGSNNNWSAMFQNGDGFMGGGLIMFDTNDIGAGRTPTQWENDLCAVAGFMDTRLGSQEFSWLICHLPLPPSQVTTGLAYVAASKSAVSRIGSHRAAVLDLAALRPGRVWGGDLSGDTSHPNDPGHYWVADVIGNVLDPFPPSRSPVTPDRVQIDASTPTAGRLSWTEAWTALTGIGGYDQSGGGTTVGERRHRVWLDPGTYRATVTMQEDTGLATVEVLIGNWQGNTPTLTSCGTKANAAGTPTLVTTRLGTSVTTQLPGYQPVVIRKTSASGAIRFVNLVIDKTA